ncbi:2-oxo acid dehydrogenase subunit E2 [Candidatus Marsarchaeota archaeon]|jgi:pyruvate dehydrogenase E2 component (dihydrolipoamide acetyltransferase)|nr:2-oxo acid dehydrogenase subunit E2 [Candidatus Marsarchaeota archaeon]
MEEIKFVDIGEGITEGRIQKWLVADMADVKEDQPVAQVETDKAVVSMPAPASGKIKIMIKEGADVKVGDVMAYVGSAGELNGIAASGAKNNAGAIETPKAKPAEAKPVEQAQSKPVEKQGQRRVLAPPSVRHMAESMGIDLSGVKGSGPGGRITEADVKAYAENKAAAPAALPAANANAANTERVPLSQTRKAIAKNMELSWQIPRASHMDLIDASAIYSVVQKEKEKSLKQLNVKLSYLPFIIKAAVEALKENPRFNASYDKDRQEVVLKKYYNIGIAAEAKDGLKVVVVKDSDKKSILEIAKEIDSLHKKVLDQTISLQEMRDTSFTITNVGSLGGGFLAIPMINYPDVAILGITLVRDMPVVKDGAVVPGKILPFTITFDHRVVDGAEAVKFGNAFKGYMEDPEFLDML